MRYATIRHAEVRRSFRKGAWAGALVAILLIGDGRAQTSGDADLERLRGEIGRLKSRLANIRQQSRTAALELEGADLELGIRTRELQIATDLEIRAEREREQMQSSVIELQKSIASRKKFLGARLAALYRLGGVSYLRMFLSLNDDRNPIEAMSMLGYVVQRDARTVSRLQDEQAELAVRMRELVVRQNHLRDVRQQVEARRQAVLAAHREKARLVARLQVQESGSEKRIAELEEKARRLERLLALLAEQSRGGTTGTADIMTVQGALDWPVKGEVIERFGRQRDPRFATYTVNNGWKISATPGTPVRVVFEGTVLFSQWFKGYGNLVIVDHGNRVFSLYGNLKAPAVSTGDRLATGQSIAGVGESEDGSTAAYLYFEVRRDNKPEDPQNWLR